MTGPALWARTASPIPVDAGQPPDHVGVLIVGAGLAGLALARMLADRGTHVAVVEARQIGAVTTGHTTGKLSLLQGDVYSRIRRFADDDTLRAYAEAQRAGQAWLREELAEVPHAIEPATAVTFAETAHGAEAIEREMEAMRAAGVVPEVAPEGAEVSALPFAPRSALLLADQSKLHATRVLGALAARLRDAGVRIVERCRVTGADVEEGGVRVATTGGAILADQLVLATGTPILDRGLFFARLEPSRSFVAAYRVPDVVRLPEGMFLSVDRDSHSLRVDPDADGHPLLLVGGGGHVVGRASSTRELIRAMDDWTRERWPGAERRFWWAAQDYRTTDAVPYAGELPRGGGRISTATGFDKWGMTNAVASALRITTAMSGGAPAWAAALEHHGTRWTAAAEAVREGAAVGAKLVSGWVRAETTRTDAVPAEGEGRLVAEGTHPVAVSTVDGVTCRVSGVCTHMGGALSWNDAERSWDCPLHGSRFAPDGTRLEGPAVEDLEAR